MVMQSAFKWPRSCRNDRASLIRSSFNWLAREDRLTKGFWYQENIAGSFVTPMLTGNRYVRTHHGRHGQHQVPSSQMAVGVSGKEKRRVTGSCKCSQL